MKSIAPLRLRGAGCVLLAGTLSGCSIEDTLGTSEALGLWLLVPLVIFGVLGWLGISQRRTHHLSSWDLRTSPEEPDTRSLLRSLSTAAVVVLLLFLVVNVRVALSTQDWQQFLWNMGAWFVGTWIGCVLALWTGLKAGEPRELQSSREEG